MGAHTGRVVGLTVMAGIAGALATAAPALADSRDDTSGPPAHSATEAGAPRAVRCAAPPLRNARPVGAVKGHPQIRPQPASSPLAVASRPNPIQALLNNSSPRPTGTQTSQTPTGVVSGSLQGNDPDGDGVAFSVADGPAHGAVTVSGNQFSYTADPTLAHTGYVDSFRIAASDAGSGFHLHGPGGLINLLTFGLIGVSGHTATSTVSVRVAPFNNAPTATVTAGGPDPRTGTVTGQVNGRDPNGDALTYTGPLSTPNATVTVTPGGAFTYTPTADALAASTPGGQDRFTVTVADGYGGITSVDVVVPLGSSPPTGPLSTFCGCTLMPAGTVFHADVGALPVLPKSGTWTRLLGGTLHASWGGAPWQGSTAGMPVNIAGPNQAGETVIFNRGYGSTGPGIDNTPYAIPDRPLVEGMPDVPAWDRHLLVFQQGTCVSQELYNVANGVELPAAGPQDALGNAAYAALYGSSWVAEAGGHVDMNSPLYPAQGWANASRLPYLPLILRPDDMSRGSIDHMLGIAIAKDRGTGFTWPARAGDGTGTNPDGVPMGTVLRLRPDFDISGYDASTQVVLRALQQHGAVVFDSFGAGRDGAGLLAMSNGWNGNTYLTAQRELSTIPLSAFEAVDVVSLAADPVTGWAIKA
jgi:hypothetical protein